MILSIVCIFLLLLFLGMPIGLSMGIAGCSFFFLSGNAGFMVMLPDYIFNGLNSFVLMAIPFFLLAGEIMDRATISGRLITFSNLLVGRFPAGLAQVNVLASMFFAGITGAALGDVAALGKIFIPAMVREGYDRPFSAAVTAMSSLIGPIIPPSIVIVIYCSVTELSVGAMFAAALVPGVMMGLSQMLVIYILAKKRGYPQHAVKITPKGLVKSTKDASMALLMPVIILGGIMTGVATPTEAAACAVVYALITSFCVYRSLSLTELPDIFLCAVRGSAKLFFILAFIGIMSWVFGFENLPVMLRDSILSRIEEKWLILLLMNVFLVFVGMWMTESPAIILFAPILMPLAQSVGVHPISWGIIMVLLLVLGLVTPPVALVLFAASDIAELPVETVFRACVPLFFSVLFVIFLLNVFPEFTLFLPRAFGLLT